ncbi:MAG: bifunctional hydroxymethylpyrimidine kinase/phosphomethylpyrimidine kinase [Chthoniobacterales bacterium]
MKTFSALGVYGLTAITCVVAEIPGRVARIDAVAADMVVAQIALLLDQFPVAAIKTGLLYSAEIVARVAAALRGRAIPLVVDPVMVASSGDGLLQNEGIAVYEQQLFPLAALITPNLDEAATLLGEQLTDLDAMRKGGLELHARYQVPILLKGGHLGTDEAVDLLFTASGVAEFRAPFTRGVETHGSGCTYAAAITASLACGCDLPEAVRRAKRYVSTAIAQSFRWAGRHGAPIDALHHQPPLA